MYNSPPRPLQYTINQLIVGDWNIDWNIEWLKYWIIELYIENWTVNELLTVNELCDLSDVIDLIEIWVTWFNRYKSTELIQLI